VLCAGASTSTVSLLNELVIELVVDQSIKNGTRKKIADLLWL
jgi:hypothetical protein